MTSENNQIEKTRQVEDFHAKKTENETFGFEVEEVFYNGTMVIKFDVALKDERNLSKINPSSLNVTLKQYE
jgi:hypothetical protein